MQYFFLNKILHCQDCNDNNEYNKIIDQFYVVSQSKKMLAIHKSRQFIFVVIDYDLLN